MTWISSQKVLYIYICIYMYIYIHIHIYIRFKILVFWQGLSEKYAYKLTSVKTRVKYRNREDLLRTSDSIRKEIGVPLVVTYHPQLNVLNKIIRRNLTHLFEDQLVRSALNQPLLYCLEQHVTSGVIWFVLNFILWNELLVPISAILLVAK